MWNLGEPDPSRGSLCGSCNLLSVKPFFGTLGPRGRPLCGTFVEPGTFESLKCGT